MPPDHRQVLRVLVAWGLAGFGLMAWGLVWLEPWPTIFGATLVVMARLWRSDRFDRLWERAGHGPA